MGSPGRLTLTVDPDPYVVARLPARAAWPQPPPGAGFFSATRTAAELSVVAPPEGVPAGATVDGDPWRRLEVAGPLDLALVGVMSELAGILAGAGVSVFPVATHDTDHLLVRADRLDAACDALRAAGHRVG